MVRSKYICVIPIINGGLKRVENLTQNKTLKAFLVYKN